jgi:hypothetical protein
VSVFHFLAELCNYASGFRLISAYPAAGNRRIFGQHHREEVASKREWGWMGSEKWEGLVGRGW